MTYRMSDEIEDALTPEVIAAGWDKFREGRQSQPMLQLLAGGPGLKEVFIAMAAAMRGFRIVRADGIREALDAEREMIVQCSRSTNWVGPEEIVSMIRQRRGYDTTTEYLQLAELDKESEPKK